MKFSLWRWIKCLLVHLVCLFVFSEYVLYYIKIGFTCSYPSDQLSTTTPIRAMLVADTHLLGPFRGHWLDRLKREFQMHRAFQTALTIHRPELVVFLGDLFDEGKWVNEKQFDEYMYRFYTLFHTKPDVKVVAVAGNHDIGFHYDTRPGTYLRFEDQFSGSTGASMFTMTPRGQNNDPPVHFVVLNSVAMEGDHCQLCEKAETQLKNISKTLSCWQSSDDMNKSPTGLLECSRVAKILPYSSPVLLQHYPLFRDSDKNCAEGDALKTEKFRERWEVLSKDATDLVGRLLKPRVAFSGHSHDYCYLVQRESGAELKKGRPKEEYTIPSFSWRNRDNPGFALATFTATDHHVQMCWLPRESIMDRIYILGIILSIVNVWRLERTWWSKSRSRGIGYTKVE